MNEQVLRRPANRYRQLVDELGGAIVEGRLAGTLPTEEALCADLGVGRGALREAMKALVAKGLIEIRPRTGTRVLDPEVWNRLDHDVIRWWWAADPDAVGHHVQELRELLEPASAERAAERATPAQRDALESAAAALLEADDAAYLEADLRFHLTLWRLTANPLLGSIGSALSAVLHHVFQCSSAAGRTAEAAHLHHAIAAAVAAHDPLRAHEASRALLEAARSDFRSAREDAP